MEWLAKTGYGPTTVNLRVTIDRKRREVGDWVEVTVTSPQSSGRQLVLFQEELPLGDSPITEE